VKSENIKLLTGHVKLIITSSVTKKFPIPKFGLKSSSLDIYEWLFLIHKLEKSAFVKKTKQIMNILHKIPLIENKK